MLQLVQIRNIGDQPRSPQIPQQPFAQALAHARGVILQAARRLPRACCVRAAQHVLILPAVQRLAAARAGRGDREGRGGAGAEVREGAGDLRDDVTGSADDDAVSDAQVELPYGPHVMQRGLGDTGALEEHGLEEGHGHDLRGSWGEEGWQRERERRRFFCFFLMCFLFILRSSSVDRKEGDDVLLSVEKRRTEGCRE